MSKTYNFVEQLEKGKAWEKVLDDYFSQWYDIQMVSMREERRGIDRKFKPKGDVYKGDYTNVEYKADEKTQDTGNIFVETYSVVELGRYGWAYTSEADIIAYLAIPDKIYMFKPVEVRHKLLEWKEAYKTKAVSNPTYTSAGILVPEDVFAEICTAIRFLDA
jgi:hypothetical protein